MQTCGHLETTALYVVNDNYNDKTCCIPYKSHSCKYSLMNTWMPILVWYNMHACDMVFVDALYRVGCAISCTQMIENRKSWYFDINCIMPIYDSLNTRYKNSSNNITHSLLWSEMKKSKLIISIHKWTTIPRGPFSSWVSAEVNFTNCTVFANIDYHVI